MEIFLATDIWNQTSYHGWNSHTKNKIGHLVPCPFWILARLTFVCFFIICNHKQIIEQKLRYLLRLKWSLCKQNLERQVLKKFGKNVSLEIKRFLCDCFDLNGLFRCHTDIYIDYHSLHILSKMYLNIIRSQDVWIRYEKIPLKTTLITER